MSKKIHSRIGVFSGAACSIIALVVCSPAYAEKFNLPAQSAATGITQFGRQSRLQIIAPAAAVANKNTNAVVGDMEPREALKELLRSTGLTVKADDGRTIVISQATVASARLIAQSEQSVGPEPAQAIAPPPAEVQADDGQGDILVTARQRSESLTNVPVAVTAISASDLLRSNANDLSRIAELSPNVIVSNIGNQGGGSIAIRGISSPANSLGFEQAVSVSVDGVQTSNGYVASAGYFDMAQVEVLKGPQALLFGKNSPAGVISLRTAQPTSNFYANVRSTYEFVADELLVDGVISGPLTDTLGARLAVRGRRMEGWLRNDARPITDNPFIPGLDGGLPGAHDDRVGDKELAGRLTLQYDPSNALKINAKLTHDRIDNGGGGLLSQSVGICPSGRPNLFGQFDPYGECKPDNHLTSSDPPPEVVQTFPKAPKDGKTYGHVRIWSGVLTAELNLDTVNITSITGYNQVRQRTFYNHDQTSLGQLFGYESTNLRSFSQELRALSDLDGPFNVMVGGYYQKQRNFQHNMVLINDTYFNPVTGVYETYDKQARLNARTVSAFAQGILEVNDFEATAGLRWTNEKKSFEMFNTYGFPATAFPVNRVIAGKNSDNNLSPEVTASWHPMPRTTIYAAYRTGYKSGSFNMTSPVQATTQLSGVSFGPEKAKGFELGAKGDFLDNRLFVDLNIFKYKYSDLQVNSYNPALVAYSTVNVGSVKQHGVELQVKFEATERLKLRSSLAWVHNRFHDYVGQCYGYSYPAGDTTSPAPPNCNFRTGTRILEQNFEGRAPARSPDWTGNAGFTYVADLGSGGRVEFSGDAFYSDSYYASETMASSTFQNSFWRLNAGVTLHDADDRWSLGLIGRNLTNKYYMVFGADSTGGTSIPLLEGKQRVPVARGREVALQLNYQF